MRSNLQEVFQEIQDGEQLPQKLRINMLISMFQILPILKTVASELEQEQRLDFFLCIQNQSSRLLSAIMRQMKLF
jgi:hypothetical protein